MDVTKLTIIIIALGVYPNEMYMKSCITVIDFFYCVHRIHENAYGIISGAISNPIFDDESVTVNKPWGIPVTHNI